MAQRPRLKIALRLVQLFLGFGLVAAAQSLVVSVSPTTIPSTGGFATVTISFQDASPTANVTALQWVTSFGPALNVSTGVPTTVQNSKPVSCPTPGCISAGTASTNLNVTAFAAGPVATYPITINSGASGQLTLTLTSVAGASTSGVMVPMTVVPTKLSITSQYDLTGDGVVDGQDVAVAVQIASKTITGGLTQCTGPFSQVKLGDGSPGACSIAALVQVLRAATGIIQ